MPVDYVYLQAPYGGEIREVEATPDVLVPLLVQGWYQVPAPADREATAPIGIIEDAEQSGVSTSGVASTSFGSPSPKGGTIQIRSISVVSHLRE